MNNMQDLTQKERVEEGLLSTLIGCGCEGGVPMMPRNEANTPEYQVPCGRCPVGGAERRACGFGVDDGVLASVYAPLQGFVGVYDPDTALVRGTMFEGLDKPFFGDERGGKCFG